MNSEKKIGVSISTNFFIAHIEAKGVHKIQRYPRNKNGMKDFFDELDDNTVICVEKCNRSEAFIKSVRHLIKDYLVLCHEDFITFTSFLDDN